MALSEAQIRAVLQLPPRPASDSILCTGDRYYDLSHFEALSIYTITGTTGSNTNYTFASGSDYNLSYGVVDFGGAVNPPLLGTTFKVNYSYSALGEDTVSTSIYMASTTVLMQLASTFPYGGSSAGGAAYADLATIGTITLAAHQCALALAAGETTNAIKYRRGAIQMDETAKAKNWMELADLWEKKYQEYLKFIRPTGKPSVVLAVGRNGDQLVFNSDYVSAEMSYLAGDQYGTYGGVL